MAGNQQKAKSSKPRFARIIGIGGLAIIILLAYLIYRFAFYRVSLSEPLLTDENTEQAGIENGIPFEE